MNHRVDEVPELRAWGESIVPLESADASQQRRRRLLPVVERAIVAEGRRARLFDGWLRGSAVAACAMLVAGAGVGLWHGVWAHRAQAEARVATGTAQWLRHGQTSVVVPGSAAALEEGDVIATGPEGTLAVVLASGASVALQSASRLSLEHASADSEVVRLEAGGVDVRVPKLGPSRRFAVRTRDALVTVHGTAFSVAFDAPPRGGTSTASTRVTVAEGVVGVQCLGAFERRLLPGESFGCSEPAPSEAWTATPVAHVAPAQDNSASRPSSADGRALMPRPTRSVADSPAAKGSSLAEENRVFAEAMASSRAGDNKHAADLLQGFLDRYPGSTLVEEASVERFRALTRMGQRESASRAAARYLMLFRDGFARDEARRLVIGTETSGPSDP